MHGVLDSGDGRRAREDLDDPGLQTASQIVGIIFAFCAVMVVLRFLINTGIDLAILRDSSSLIRCLSQIRRFICPWWHPRTQPQDLHGATAFEAQNTTLEDVEAGSRDMHMLHVLSGLTRKERYDLLSSILGSKKVGTDDIARWRVLTEDYSGSDDGGDSSMSSDKKTTVGSNNLCPICIHEFCVDEMYILSRCDHHFHSECLVQWLSNRNRDCPCCRSEIMTQEMLRQALCRRMQCDD